MGLYRKPDHADATGDAIPFYHNGKYHIFSLTPPPGTGTYPERLRTTWHHVCSDNLMEWEDLGTALAPGGPDEPDADGCWTGAVIFAEGAFHAYYTGYSIQANFQQTICHATSRDGKTWTKDNGNPCLTPNIDLYERHDWRDPYVFYNEDDKQYWLILSARKKSGPVMRRGCIVLYRSTDLKHWEHYGPIYEPGHTNCPECPELYRIDQTWYLAYSRFSEFGGTIYRIAESPFGPWRTPKQDRIGSRRFYAAKSARTGDGRRLYFGWTPDRADKSDRGEWYWGGAFAAPHEAVPSPEGQGLEIRLPRDIADAFCDPIVWDYTPLQGDTSVVANTIRAQAVGTFAYGFLSFSARRFLLSCTVRPEDCRDHFGFVLKSDQDLARHLLVAIQPGTQMVSLLNYPYPVDPFWEASVASMVDGALPGPDGPRVGEAFLNQNGSDAIDVEILVDNDLIEVFIGRKVALNYRWYDIADHEFGIIVQDGNVTIDNIVLKQLPSSRSK